MDNALPFIGIPILNRGDLLERLIKSIDYPVETVFIINNGKDESVRRAIEKITGFEYPSDKPKPGLFHRYSSMGFVSKYIIVTSAKNLGVAGSWNTFITRSNNPYWFICGNDMMFRPGELKQIAEFAAKNHETYSMIYAMGYSAFMMTNLGLKTVGTFDENIYPAYLEDCDHFYRLKLSGAKATGFADKELMIHGEAPNWGSSTIHSDEHYRKANAVTHGRNFEYYIKKWGGAEGNEVYRHPFNDPSKPLNFWELDIERRKLQEAEWLEKLK